VTLPFVIQVKRLIPGMKNLLRLLKHFLVNDLQFRPLRHQPFRLILFLPLTGKEICYFLFAINYLSGIKFIRKDTADGVLAPSAVSFCSDTLFSQFIGNGRTANSVLNVPLTNLTDHVRFFLIYRQIEIIPYCLIIAVNNIW